MHAQRARDMVHDKALQVHARHHLDDAAQHVGGHAIFERSTWLALQRQPGELGQHFRIGLTTAQEVPLAVHALNQRIAEGAVGQTGGVPEQVVHGHLALRWLKIQATLPG
ncbi:hypothetical protein D3C78_1448980 [compost metagenome]